MGLGTLMTMALSMRQSTMALATTWFGEDLAPVGEAAVGVCRAAADSNQKPPACPVFP